MTGDKFTGFSAQALKFLRDLKKNNDRAWFAPRKEIFERECLAPLRALTVDLASALRKARVPIDADPSRVGFRIYRDVRFSRDKSPYKTNLGTYLPYRGVRGAPGGLYVHITPKESFVVAGFYQLDKEPLQRWREAMASDPKRFQSVMRALQRNGLGLSEEHETLKRMPRGFEAMAEIPIARYFKTEHVHGERGTRRRRRRERRLDRQEHRVGEESETVARLRLGRAGIERAPSRNPVRGPRVFRTESR